MPRQLSDAAREAIHAQRRDTCDLIYMDVPSGALRLALASQPIRYPARVGGDGLIYQPVGGAVVPGPVEETPDLDGQGQEIQFVAIDPDGQLVAEMLQASHFNRDFRHVRLHFHTTGADVGKVRAAYMMFEGKMNGQVLIDDIVDEEGIEPGTMIVRFRALGPLALLDVVRNIRTNTRSHQKWFPGDLGFEHVQVMQNHTVYWGIEAAKGAQ